MYIHSQSPEHWASTTLISDKSLNTYSSETEQENSPEKEQMVKDIYVCYGGAGAAFAGTPTTLCQSSNFNSQVTKNGVSPSFRSGEYINSSERSENKLSFESVNKLNSHYIPTQTNPNNNEIDVKQIYLGSITVVGLFVLFRILQKSY